MKLLLISIFSFFLIWSSTAWSSACCGGSFAVPTLIAGDEKAQVTSSFSYSEIKNDVYSSGAWNKRQTSEASETFKVDAAHIFKDRWQAGASLPIIKRTKENESSTGLGDISTMLGYEFLPDWDYNPYRPKGIGFLQIVLPTGKSIYESESRYALDSRGKGFWTLGVGSLFTKTIRKYDAFVNFDIHRSLKKSVSNESVDGTLKPGWGGTLGIGAGYSKSKFRIGLSNTWSYEDRIEVQGTPNSRGAPQRFSTVNLSASYLQNQDWASTLTYSDQTLMGSPTNTTLSRSVFISIQRRWLR